MSPRQKKFCEYYAACGNAAEAARQAGYSEKTAKQQGARMLTYDDLRDYIRELQEEQAQLRIASAIMIKGFWSDIMNDTSQKTTDRLRASELLGKAAGMFVDVIDVGDKNKKEVMIYLPDNGRDSDDILEVERVETW